MRLVNLIPELLELVDAKTLPLMTGVDISFIEVKVQKYLYEYISENGMVKSYQVLALRKYIDSEAADCALLSTISASWVLPFSAS